MCPGQPNTCLLWPTYKSCSIHSMSLHQRNKLREIIESIRGDFEHVLGETFTLVCTDFPGVMGRPHLHFACVIWQTNKKGNNQKPNFPNRFGFLFFRLIGYNRVFPGFCLTDSQPCDTIWGTIKAFPPTLISIFPLRVFARLEQRIPRLFAVIASLVLVAVAFGCGSHGHARPRKMCSGWDCCLGFVVRVTSRVCSNRAI